MPPATSNTAQSNSESYLGKDVIQSIHNLDQGYINASLPGALGSTNTEIINNAIVSNTTPDASLAVDNVNAVGLSNLGKVLLDAHATIAATSTAKSTADASNVSANSAGLAIVDGNFGLNGADEIGVKSDGGLNATASTTVIAAASTSKGDAVSLASIQESAGITNINDLDVGGELSAIGKAANTITSSAETVVNAGTSADGISNGAQATAELFGTQQGFNAQSIDSSSNASIQGISSLTNTATASVTTGDLALAEGLAGKLIGANLAGIDVGGIANVTGQTTFGNTSKASNVEGDAKAISRLGSADGLISKTDALAADLGTTSAFEVSSDATLKGLISVTAGATAETTKGDAVATNTATNINGADFQGTLDIGGIGSITGAANFNLDATASSVTPDDSFKLSGAQATAGGENLSSFGLKGATGSATANNLKDQDTTNDVFGIDVASDATLSGTAIGTLKADASSTADDATARAGLGAELTGADIGSFNVGGIANLTGAAQLTSTAIAENVGANDLDALAESGLNTTTVSGLDASFIDVASNATITAQAFGTLNATANSTGGDSTAKAGQYTSGAGESTSVLTGLETGLDLNIGGIGTLSALAQGSENASATTVDGIATASAGLDLNGAIGLDFASSSDGSLTGIARLAATVDASSTANTAQANGDFSAIGFSGLDIGTYDGPGNNNDVIGIGGISTLKGQAQITGTLNTESVSGNALAGVGDFASSIVGMHDVVLNGASDGTILGTASGVFNTNAESTGANASGFSSQSLVGISSLNLELGGNGGINAIVNDTNFVGAQSVSGNATAVASVNAIGLDGGDMHIAGNASIMSTVGVDSKSESHTIA
ncbi:hypothetical protein [Synechococcus sp. UW140]|uniref:beta strand repeat-containing protein n=1 Tax=Synechococcus sp. UW140 TaxID=368503 RepID=UPI0031381FC1